MQRCDNPAKVTTKTHCSGLSSNVYAASLESHKRQTVIPQNDFRPNNEKDTHK